MMHRHADTGGVDRLEQLFARSMREIAAHGGDLAETETGSILINKAAQLLAVLRLWAQSQHRSDKIVQELLEMVDVVSLRNVAAELRAIGDADALAASAALLDVLKLPSEQLMAIASYALRAL
jgi:hypothetical protein